MIPFDSWDGRNDISGTVEQNKLEKYLGPAVAFGTYQGSISAILEVLGSRTHLIPVVMPITASPDTIAATLRAGGDPLLLDIRPQTLQMDPGELRTVLDELKTAVVILPRPGGQLVDPELLELTKELPTILDSRLPPHADIEDSECVCTFNVFDLGPVIGTGSVVVHKFEQQLRELKLVRNGLLGLAGNLNDALAAFALKRLREDPGLQARRNAQATVAGHYIELLKEKYVFPFDQSPEWPYFIVRVENADTAVAHLHHEIEVVKPVFPLHMLSDINRRWVEKPEYPVAEGLWRKLVALPTHMGILGKESMIVDKLSEVAHG